LRESVIAQWSNKLNNLENVKGLKIFHRSNDWILKFKVAERPIKENLIR